ncbi:predicted protein, partial [Nematostella vectensis]
VFFMCKYGFKLIGSPVRKCGKDNKWTGTQPRCEIVDCGPLRAPMNGHVIGNETTFHKIVRFSCNPGYKMHGYPDAICQANGEWSNTVTCLLVGLSCGQPRDVRNAEYKLTGTGFNDNVTYTCNEGFTVIGTVTKRCTAKGEWGGALPTCMADCPKPSHIPENAFIVNEKERYMSGERVTFKCKPGYNQEGLATTLCFLGDWNIMPFKCEKGGCGDPGLPENGAKVGLSYGVGARVFFTCKLGFNLKGSPSRRCGEDNKWTGTQPRCESKTVSFAERALAEEAFRLFYYKLPLSTLQKSHVDINSGSNSGSLALETLALIEAPTNGSVIGNETTFQKIMRFACDPGFEMDGNPVAICQSDGKWSSTVTCNPVNCGSLDAPAHGSVSGDSTTFTSRLVFSCDAGYIMSGSPIRTCLKNASWSGTQPRCDAVECGKLAVPRNGTRVGTLWTFPNTVRFACDEGFELSGSAVRTCQADGSWNGTLSECNAVDCGPLPVPMNGSIPGEATVYPFQREVKCDRGFILRGSRFRLCQADGSWSGRTRDCGPLATPTNGTKTGSLTTFPNKVTFSCDEGFILIGSPLRSCQSSGKWSGEQVRCEALDCGFLATPMNGSKIGAKTFFPNQVLFSCDEGFELIGSARRACLSNGSWSGVSVICKAHDCGPLVSPLNGTKTGSLTTFPNIITFKCDPGFNLIGSPKRTCQSNARWSGQMVSCKARDCGPLTTPRNGSKLGSLTTFPNKVHFWCDEGFDLLGSKLRVCQANAIWSGDKVTCQARDCGPLNTPLNGTKTGSLTTFPNTVKFMCDEGFNLIGSRNRTCQSNGKWSGQQVACGARDCGPLPTPMNGTKIGSLTTFPNKVTFTCVEGFNLIGSSIRHCQSDSTWSGSQPTCKVRDCGPLPVPANGKMLGLHTTYPSDIHFRCYKGFNLIGSPTRSCQSNAKWSGKEVSCNAVDCGPLAAPMNGSSVGNLTVFPNIIKFICDEGFDLLGSSVWRCSSDGKWDGITTTCKAVDCGPLVKPLNGSMMGSLTYYPNHVSFTCDKGFLLRGSEVRACQANRTWSGMNTRCE